MTQAASKAAPRSGTLQPLGAQATDASIAAARRVEDRLVMGLVVVSALVHLGVLLFEGFGWKRDPIVLQDDSGIVADLVTDTDVGAKESARPDTIKGEHRVPETMLPQLPKNFKIDQPPPPEEDPAPPPEPKPEPKELKAVPPPPPEPAPEPAPPPPPPQPEPPQPEPPKPAPQPEPPKEEPKPVEPVIQTPQDDSQNKLKKEDALKRLMDEQARQEQKFAKDKQAEKQDALAMAAAELAKKGVGGGGKGGASHNRYGQKLKKAVQPHYNIPEVYRMRASEYVVSVTIEVAANGSLIELAIEKSSGVVEFDESVLKAIRDAVPLPAPPPDLAGERITVNFSP